MAPKLHLPFPYCLVSLHYTGASVPNGATCTLGVLPADTSTPAQIATTIKTQLRATGGPYGSGVASWWTGTVVLQDITVKQGPLDTGPEAAVSDGAVLSSTGGAAGPPNLAVLVTKNTAQGGKRGRGRMYLPGIVATSVNGGGQLSTPALTGLQGSWNTFLTSMQAAGVGPALLHNYDTAKGQTPVSPTIITGFSVAGLMATQRNRMRR